jgi:hypothetical protein
VPELLDFATLIAAFTDRGLRASKNMQLCHLNSPARPLLALLHGIVLAFAQIGFVLQEPCSSVADAIQLIRGGLDTHRSVRGWRTQMFLEFRLPTRWGFPTHAAGAETHRGVALNFTGVVITVTALDPKDNKALVPITGTLAAGV